MNRNSIKRLIIGGTILLVTGFTALAFAQGGGYNMRGGYGHGMMSGYGHHQAGNCGYMYNNLSVEDQQNMQDHMNSVHQAPRN